MPELRMVHEGHATACHFAETLPPADLDFRSGLSTTAQMRLAIYESARIQRL
jgi:hypothetical protein